MPLHPHRLKTRGFNQAAEIARHVACPESLNGAHVLLIDDVLTTGASLSACAEVLRHAGSRRIDVAVLARTPEPGHA